MSLGPCAESVGLSHMSVYGLAVAQLPLTFVFTLHYPTAKADFFSTKARIVPNPHTNGTAVDLQNPTEMHYFHSVHISVGFVACAALITFFTIISMHIQDKGIGDGHNVAYEDYVSTNIDLVTHPTITMWNNIFLAFVVVYHGLLVTIVNSPTSIHLLLLVVLLTYVSLNTILQPKVQYENMTAPGTASSVASTYMVAIAIYCLSMSYTGTNIPYDPDSAKIQLVGVVVFLDIFLLIVGHCWDPLPNFSTILNCRIMYALSIAALNIITYGLWSSTFRVPYI